MVKMTSIGKTKKLDRPTKFVEEPPALTCPVCKTVFREPVISVRCGHTFCRRCIEKMIEGGARCPIDDQECDSSQLVINRAVIEQIEDLLIHCCHGFAVGSGKEAGEEEVDGGASQKFQLDPSGCKERVKYGKRDEHEDQCSHARVTCPIGQDGCGILKRHQLERHLSNCTRVPCPFTDFGCCFFGTSSDVKEHEKVCTFKNDTQLIATFMKELKEVKAENTVLKQTVTKTFKSMEKLSAEKSAMSSQLEQQALTITSLTSRMDKLETDLESLRLKRDQHGSGGGGGGGGGGGQHPQHPHHPSRHGSTSDVAVATPQYARRSTFGEHNNSYYSGNNRRDSYGGSSVTSHHSLTHDPHHHMHRGGGGGFIWQMPFTVKCIGTFRGHKGTIWSLAASREFLYSSSSDGSIKVWDMADLRRGCLKTVSAHKDCAMCLAIGKVMLFSAGTDLSLRSWNLHNLEEVGVVERAHDGMISAMVCNKEYVFTSSHGCIKVWNGLTLQEVHRIEHFSQSWVRALAYNRRRDYLYSGSYNKIHVWRASGDFSLVSSLETNYGAIYSLAVSKKYIITGTHNQNVQVYDIATLAHVCSLTGHIGTVTVLRVTESFHGSFMFSGSSDTTVQVWNLENMLPIQALQRHEKAVHSMAIWQDSVFTGSEDMEIKVTAQHSTANNRPYDSSQPDKM